MSEKPKRFVVFAGATYYPVGGWSDFSASFDEFDAALAWARGRNDEWWEIIDLETGDEVASGVKE